MMGSVGVDGTVELVCDEGDLYQWWLTIRSQTSGIDLI